MFKHFLYSFKGKKALYFLFFLTIVLSAIVSVYSVNRILLNTIEPKTNDLKFSTTPDINLVALNNLVLSGDIEYVQENIIIEVMIGARKQRFEALRENKNRAFGNKLNGEKILVSNHLEYIINNERELLTVGNYSFEILAFSNLLDSQIIFPYNIDNDLLNVKFSSIKDCKSTVTLGNAKPLDENLKDKLIAAGLKMENLIDKKFQTLDFYEWYTYILPSAGVIAICIMCVCIAYGYILKKDSSLNDIYKTVGANNYSFLAMLIAELLAIFSVGYGIGCAVAMPIMNNFDDLFINGLDLFFIWFAFAAFSTALLILTKRKVFSLSYKKRKKSHLLKKGAVK